MTASITTLLSQLKILGSEQTRKTLMRHGAKDPIYGVKIEDLKKLIPGIPKDQRHQIALELYDTGISDAMYLAGLIADPKIMDREILQRWVDKAYWYMLSEYTVAWVAAESPFGWQVSREWIESDQEMIAAAGWSALSSYVAITPDSTLDKQELLNLIHRIRNSIHSSQNRVKYTMNGFLISVAGYVPDLTMEAKSAAIEIGKVTVEMGETACKVPYAPDYIDKMIQRGKPAAKKKTARC